MLFRSRVFGELLTYIERDYRDLPFSLAYSEETKSIPPNLLLIGTMNPFDKSIMQLDLALIRRFDHIPLKPSAEMVQKFLEDSASFSQEQIDTVTEWFQSLQALLPHGIGHTYFKEVHTPEHLRTVWKHRMLPHCDSVLELDPQKMGHVKHSFDAMYGKLVGQEPTGEPD